MSFRNAFQIKESDMFFQFKVNNFDSYFFRLTEQKRLHKFSKNGTYLRKK
jgi:hypothetical protein